MQIPEAEQNNQNKSLVLKITAFKSRVANSHNPKHDASHWESMCYQKYLRFNISLRQIFCKSGSLRVMKKSDESALMKILPDFLDPLTC